MTNEAGPNIVYNELVLNLDAANSRSYPGSGTTCTDLSNSGNNGTLINGTSFSNLNGGSFVFNGTNNYIEVANSSSLNPSQSTVICWAKSNTATWNDFGFLVSKRDAFIIHPVQSQTAVGFYYRLNNIWQSVSYTVSNITNWNMYAMSCTGTSIRGYVNGLPVASGNFTGPLSTSDTGVITIGRDDDQNRYLNGNISQVSIYNIALSDNQMLQNYNALKGRYGL